MVDLISRSELLKYATRVVEYDEGGFSMEYNAVPMDVVKSIPTIDAVPVVRCKNCKHWGTGVIGETEYVKCCEYGKYMVGENGFCVYADIRKKAQHD